MNCGSGGGILATGDVFYFNDDFPLENDECNCSLAKPSVYDDKYGYKIHGVSFTGMKTNKNTHGTCKPCPPGYYIHTGDSGETYCRACGCENRDSIPDDMYWIDNQGERQNNHRFIMNKTTNVWIPEEEACDGSGTDPLGDSSQNKCGASALWCDQERCWGIPRQNAAGKGPVCSYNRHIWNNGKNCPDNYKDLGSVDEDDNPNETECFGGIGGFFKGKLKKCVYDDNKLKTEPEKQIWPPDMCAECDNHCDQYARAPHVRLPNGEWRQSPEDDYNTQYEECKETLQCEEVCDYQRGEMLGPDPKTINTRLPSSFLP